MINYDDFSKLELRVVSIVSAERVDGSDKLLKLSVCLGDGQERQIIAGVGNKYSPEDIIDKQIIIIANLEPRKLMGLESRGMLLAAGGEDGPTLLTVLEKVADGSLVK